MIELSEFELRISYGSELDDRSMSGELFPSVFTHDW